MPGKRMSEDQRRQITAARFRREPYPQISEAHGISLTNCKAYREFPEYTRNVYPPRDETKPMGRPRLVTLELLEVLCAHVEKHPIANLGELASLLSVKFGIDLGKRNLSHYLHGAGYKLSIVSRGATSTEKSNLPDISPEDWERLESDPAARDAMTSGWGTVYVWLRNSTPVPRRVGINEAGQKSKKRSREYTDHETAGEGQDSSAQVFEPGRNEDIGDDATHKLDAIGQAHAVQSTVPGVGAVWLKYLGLCRIRVQLVDKLPQHDSFNHIGVNDVR